MADKTKRLKSIYMLLGLAMSLFMMAFSCEDHNTPAPEAPEVQTVGSNIGSNSARLDMVFSKIGNIPVTEFGVLYAIRPFGSGNVVPSESDSKAIFTPPLPTVTASKVVSVPTDGSDVIFYRAYAKLSNGTTVFGQTLSAGLLTQ